MTASTRRARIVFAALRATSRLVPRAQRSAWLGEWHAEFAHFFDAPAARDRRPAAARLAMAFRHAWWLRRNPDTVGPRKGGFMFDAIRHAARALRREPAFTLPALLTLTLGIGANVAVFSVTESVLLRPLPYPSADRLVLFRHRDLRTSLTKDFVASTDMLDVSARQQSFEAIVSYGLGRSVIYGLGEPVDVQGMQASDKLFQVAGVQAALGRGLEPEDCRQGAAPVVVIGHDLWKERFNGDPAVIGRSLTIGAAARRVVGVAPPKFTFPPSGRIDIILPMSQPATAPVPRNIGGWIFAAGRLRDGVTVERADAELKSLSSALGAEFPATNNGTQYFGLSVRAALAGDARRPLLLLMGAVSVLLVIALVNVGNLLLVRTTARSGELALRVALGAGRKRLFVQLLIENLLLTGVAAVAGVALALWGTTALVALIPPTVNIPALSETGVNALVLAYAALIAVGAGVVFSVFAAAYSGGRGAARAVVSQTRHSMSKGARRTASSLVMLEVALAVILLVGAGLIVRSFSALLGVDAGFKRSGVSTISVQLPPGRYSNGQAASAYWNRLIPALQALPDVAVAGIAQVTPLTGNNWTVPFVRADRPLDPGQRAPDIGWQMATRGYFEALKIPLRSGRLFEASDATGPPVVIISESVERRYFDRGDAAVGHRVKLGNEEAEIVGVVGDIRRASLTDDPRADMYLPIERRSGGALTLFIRTMSGRPVDAAAVREAARAIEPLTRMEPMASLGEIAEDSAAPTRLVMWLLGVFGAVALVLAAIGVYGVLSYAVRQRLREFATRMALGATHGDILWLVLRDGTVIVGMGLLAGLLISTVATRALQSLLFAVTAHDPFTLVMAAAALVAATLLGCYLPARRAAKVQPARTLAE